MDEQDQGTTPRPETDHSGRRGFLWASAAAAVLAGAALDGCAARAAAPPPARGGGPSGVVSVGTGSQDAPDLLTALATLPPTGGRVQLRAGTQVLKGGTRIPGTDPHVMGLVTAVLLSNVIVEGEGPGVTVLSGAAGEGTNLLGAWEQSGIVLRGFTLDGGGNGGYGIALFRCSDCLVEDVTVQANSPKGSLNTGIAEFGSRNRFVRCSVSGANVLGFELGYGDDGTEVISSSATGCPFGLQFDAYSSLPTNLRAGPNKNLRIISCNFSGNSNVGLLLTSCESATVSNCVLRDNGSYGLAVASLGGGSFKQQPFPAAGMHIVASGLIVSGNGTGVRLQGTGSMVTGSVFWDNKAAGVLLEGTGLVVSGCSFPSGQDCVQNNGSSGCVIVGCTRDTSATRAGLVGGGSGVTVSASPGF